MNDFKYIANFKMNGSVKSVSQWIKKIGELPEAKQKQCIFCPPSCFLSLASGIIKESRLDINLGAQNFDEDNTQSFTGGISASMLLELGCDYVIIGHSERRIIAFEDDAILLKKLASAIQSNLKIIFCIGESKEDRLNLKTFDKLSSQLSILEKFTDFQASFLLAYEPIWAIGSGHAASAQEITEVHSFLKKSLIEIFGPSSSIPTLYGGSVLTDNITSLVGLNEIQGLLIGGASLNPEDFYKIVTTY